MPLKQPGRIGMDEEEELEQLETPNYEGSLTIIGDEDTYTIIYDFRDYQ